MSRHRALAEAGSGSGSDAGEWAWALPLAAPLAPFLAAELKDHLQKIKGELSAPLLFAVF